VSLQTENKITHKPYDADQGKGNELELLRDKRLELFIFYNTASANSALQHLTFRVCNVPRLGSASTI
jgi:hypothetical protein